MRIRLIWEGKTRDPHLAALQADYLSRIAHFAEIRVEELPAGRSAPNRQKLSTSERRMLEKAAGTVKVALDERGREWTSPEFAQWMNECAVRGTREITFLAGRAEGFSAAFREKADILLALSRITLTHDWARTLLLEQIYRSFTLQRGYPYPR